MNALQLNTNLYQSLGIISEDENVLRKAAKYLSNLAKQVKRDPTRMSEDEYFAMLEKSEQQYARGEYVVQKEGESVTEMLKRCGYDL